MGINDCAKFSAITPLRKLKTNILKRTIQQGRTLFLLKCINTKEAKLDTNGLIRDQRYRTGHDAGMPMPD